MSILYIKCKKNTFILQKNYTGGIMIMGVKTMIKKFSVKNFKNFREKLVLDFSRVRDYEFNDFLIKNGIVN